MNWEGVGFKFVLECDGWVRADGMGEWILCWIGGGGNIVDLGRREIEASCFVIVVVEGTGG